MLLILQIICIYIVNILVTKKLIISYIPVTILLFFIIIYVIDKSNTEKFDNEYGYALQHGNISNGTVFASDQESGLGWIL